MGKLFWSPDSKYLAFVNIQETLSPDTTTQKRFGPKNISTIISTQHSLWVLPLQENAQPTFVGKTVSLQKPVWSPDGKHLAFISLLRQFCIYDIDHDTVNRIADHYDDLIWVNNEVMAYSISFNVENRNVPHSALFSIRQDGTERKQIFP